MQNYITKTVYSVLLLSTSMAFASGPTPHELADNMSLVVTNVNKFIELTLLQKDLVTKLNPEKPYNLNTEDSITSSPKFKPIGRIGHYTKNYYPADRTLQRELGKLETEKAQLLNNLADFVSAQNDLSQEESNKMVREIIKVASQIPIDTLA